MSGIKDNFYKRFLLEEEKKSANAETKSTSEKGTNYDAIHWSSVEKERVSLADITNKTRNVTSPTSPVSECNVDMFNFGHLLEKKSSCKHKFPFQMITSHPKSYIRQDKLKLRDQINHYRLIPVQKDDKSSEKNRLSKHELLELITKKDNEIVETERKLKHLRRITDCNERKIGKVRETSIRKLSEQIYSENKSKATYSENLENKLKNPYENEIISQNSLRYKQFFPKLVNYLKKKQERLNAIQKEQASRLIRMNATWGEVIDQIENSDSWIKDFRDNFEYFEKIFPKIKCQREAWQIYKSTRVKTRQQPTSRNYATFFKDRLIDWTKNMVPRVASIPTMLVSKGRERYYVNNNGLVRDFEEQHKQYLANNLLWTEEEIEIFEEKFVEKPKLFHSISSHLKAKTTKDCVQYYYLTKKQKNYKLLVLLREGRRLRPKYRKGGQLMLNQCQP